MTHHTFRPVLAGSLVLVGVLLLAVSGQAQEAAAPDAPAAAEAPAPRRIEFTDVPRQTEEFMRYERTITLTPEQERIKRDALSALDAPCCSDETAYTCCCPCNMARAWWGLSNHLIADRGFDTDEVRTAVADWFTAINPDGFTGDACYSPGGCTRPFARNGCGGMQESNVIWD